MPRDLDTLNAELWKARALALEDIILRMERRFATLDRDRSNLRSQYLELKYLFEHAIRDRNMRDIEGMKRFEYERNTAQLFEKGMFDKSTLDGFLDEIKAQARVDQAQILHYGDLTAS